MSEEKELVAGRGNDGFNEHYEIPRRYSTDIEDAWLVVEKLARLEPHPWMLTLQNWNYYGDRRVTARFTTHALGPEPVEERCATAPEAICLAALAAVSLSVPPIPKGTNV